VSSASGNLFSIPALKPNVARAKKAMFMIWVVLGIDVISFFSDWMQYALLNGSNISSRAAESNDTRVQVIAILWLLFWIISGITFIRWFWRSYENVKLFSGETRFGPGWACGAWFTPFICLWRPYQIMKDIFQRTNELLNKFEIKQELKMGVMRGWWFLWIISAVLSQIIFRNNDTSLPGLKNITVISMIDHILEILLALLTIHLIKKHSESESKIAGMRNI
jgi:hypothetical protein